jgi:hypothetical protein
VYGDDVRNDTEHKYKNQRDMHDMPKREHALEWQKLGRTTRS